MKKVFSIFLAVLMVISILPISAFAQDDILNYLTYEINDGEASITDCDESISGDVVLPDTIAGYPLTSIDNYAFENCTKLTSMKIPENLSSIGYAVFYNCQNLSNINVSENNQYYSNDEYGVLFNKDKSELIRYPEGNSSSEYTIPDSVKTIDSYAFGCCDSLESITMPDDLTEIGSSAFYDCYSITEITIGAGVKYIGSYAFEYCSKLANVTFCSPERFTDGNIYIGVGAFSETKYFSNCIDANGYVITPEGILLSNIYVDSNTLTLQIPDTVKYIASYAINSSYTPNATLIIFNSDVTVETSGIADSKRIVFKSIVFNGNCYLKLDPFQGCASLETLVFNKNLKCVGSLTHDTGDTTVIYNNRTSNTYDIRDNDGTLHGVVTKTSTVMSETFDASCSYIYSGGYYENSAVKYMASTDSTVYAIYGFENKVQLYRADKNIAVASISNDGFKCAAATIGEDDNLYLLWVKDSSDDEYQESPDTVNIIVSKYNLEGKLLGNCEFPVSDTGSIYPLDAGNAAISYSNGTIGVIWDTLWAETDDGYNHQGSEFAAINAESMKQVFFNGLVSSHSFGVSMIPTEDGFAFINNCDAGSRGITFDYYIIDNSSYFYFISTINMFHSPGQYGSNEQQLDGNETYIALGGIAKSGSTYAIAARGEKIYTSDIYYNSEYRTKNYDVFVKIADQTLLNNVAEDSAGKDRIDMATGEVVDTNVIWLTSYDETQKADGVKVVILES